MFYKDRTIKVDTYVKIPISGKGDKYPVIALEGEHKGKIVAWTDNIYLKNVRFIAGKGKRPQVLGYFGGFVPPQHKEVGHKVTVDMDKGSFITEDGSEVLAYNMATFFGKNIKIMP